MPPDALLRVGFPRDVLALSFWPVALSHPISVSLVPRRVGFRPVPQNRLVHKGLQGITCEQVLVQNEMLGHRRMEQLIGSSRAKNPDRLNGATQAGPDALTERSGATCAPMRRCMDGARQPRTWACPATPCGDSSNGAMWGGPCPPPS